MSSPATEAMAEHARHAYRKPDAARAALLAAHGMAGGCDLCGASKADAVHVAATMRPRLVRG